VTTPGHTTDVTTENPAPAIGSASSDSDSALLVHNLTVHYGPVVAVNDVTLRVGRGTVTGLIGPNGAGKTTFIDALSGFVPATGQVHLPDRKISGLRPHRRQRLGVARTFQSLELFDDLTVVENLVANCNFSPWHMVRDVLTGRPGRPPEFVEELLDVFNLQHLRSERVSNLSHGHRKIVSIARAMASQPHVLLLDEPAAGLDSGESRWLGEQLRSVVGRGISILLVEHDMDLVLSTCDYLYVLDFGTLIAQGTAEEVSKNPKVIAAYLGGPATATTHDEDAPTDA
jgi:ABC-type branched-subunit amino acid transport system ATPase component